MRSSRAGPSPPSRPPSGSATAPSLSEPPRARSRCDGIAAARGAAEQVAAVEQAKADRQAAEDQVEAARQAVRQAERAVEAARRNAARVGGELAAVNQFLRIQTASPGGAAVLADQLEVEPGYELAVTAA